VAPDPKPVIDELIAYAGSDLVCYWASGRRGWSSASAAIGSLCWTIWPCAMTRC
jgi:hypothetical protein